MFFVGDPTPEMMIELGMSEIEGGVNLKES